MFFAAFFFAAFFGISGHVGSQPNDLRSREKGDWQREKVGFRFTELNVADMRRVPVPVPDFDEQRRIVDYLEQLSEKVVRLRRNQELRREEIAALQPSSLNAAFNGQL
jgi:type I restriction enzyme S subunit